MCIHIGHLCDPSRFKFMNRFIDEINTYECDTDLFIHTNKEIIPEEVFVSAAAGSIRTLSARGLIFNLLMIFIFNFI